MLTVEAGLACYSSQVLSSYLTVITVEIMGRGRQILNLVTGEILREIENFGLVSILT